MAIASSNQENFTQAACDAGAHVVYCHNHPLNVSPVADAAIEIFEHRARNATPENPAVLLVGEAHARPLHRVLLLGILARVWQQRQNGGDPFGFGYEIPRNELSDAIRRRTHYPVTDDLRHAFDALDVHGERSLKVQIVYTSSPEAPAARNNLFLFCLAQGIGVQFNDLPSTSLYDPQRHVSEPILDLKDPYTNSILALFQDEYKKRENPAIPLKGSLGCRIRNHGIADSIMAYTRAAGVKKFIQHCGLSHVFGSEASGDSLQAQLERRGAHVIPVVHTDFLKIAPTDSATALGRGLIVDGLNNASYSWNGVDKEEDFLEEICRISAIVFAGKPMWHHVARLHDELHVSIPLWINEARNALKLL